MLQGENAFKDDWFVGISVRDYFAAKALLGLMQWDAVVNGRNSTYINSGGIKELTNTVYVIADAMLKERDK